MPLTLYVTAFCVCASFSLLFPVMPSYATEVGASVSEVGLVMATYAYVTALALIPCGMLSDRIGRRPLLIASLLIFSLAPLLYLVAGDPQELLLFRGIHGLASAAFTPVAIPLVIDMAPPARRGRALGWYTTSTQSGFVAGPAIGGFLLSNFGFQAVFFGCSAIAFLGLLFILPRLTTIPRKPAPDVAMDSPWSWLKGKRVYGALLTPFFIVLGSGTIVSFMPLYGEGFGIGAAEAGFIIAALYIGSALLRAPAGRLSDSIGREIVIISGLTISTIAIAPVSSLSSFQWLVVAAAFFGIGMGLAVPAAYALLADLSPPGVTGLAMGIASTFLHAGFAAGATLMGIIAQVSDFKTMFNACALSVAVGLLLIFGLTRARR